MTIGRKILLAAAKSEFLARQASNRYFAKRAVKKFMPGEAPEDALDAGAILSREGRGTVFTKLGENLTRLEEAEAVRDHYLGLFDQIRERGIPGHVTIDGDDCRGSGRWPFSGHGVGVFVPALDSDDGGRHGL